MKALRQRNRVAVWFETTRRPGIPLILLVIALYAPSLGDGFILDDHRAMRVLREYHAGERPSPDVYRFLSGDPERNRAERDAGWYPWWMDDDLKYQHMRPLAEWVLYGQYLVFGDRPMGYRVVGLALYAAGVLLVLRLLRIVGGDERLARWGALIFAAAASHAVPVLFISAQGDVIALVCAAGVVIAVDRFVGTGSAAGIVLFAVSLVIGLGMKEAMLPLAAAPLLVWRIRRGESAAGRRAFAALAVSAVTAVAWLLYYSKGDYGSNTSVMLDPVRAFGDYLAAAPLRALLLLSSWVIPVNPFLFELTPGVMAYRWVYAVIGGAAIGGIAILFLVRHRQQRGVGWMALWAIAFLPILVCTPPDDRVMVLPSIGLAFLGAAWMTRPRRDGSQRLRLIPLFLFVAIQVTTVWTTGWLLSYLESQSQLHLKMMADAFGRPMREGDHIFVINNRYAFEGLFIQDRFLSMPGAAGRATILSDSGDTDVMMVDDRTLLLSARAGDPMLSGFLGRMGTTRGHAREVGEAMGGSGFEARVIEASDGLRSVKLRFSEPVESEHFHFFEIQSDGTPRVWTAVPHSGHLLETRPNSM
ncbi:MAG: hypothetical protein B6D36_04595 [Planctomycetes bacterium UTPLA1]|nr:MAG: hypothetical protein B6D36_04595 [Planctomycetes bacterium UTPLA1]